MVFSSTIFLFYFLPILLLVYFLVPYRFKNLTLLIASIFFFAWGAPKFILLLLIAIVIDFVLANKIYKSDSKKAKSTLMWLSVLLNLGMLAYFKYANFFVENLSALFQLFGSGSIRWAEVLLPIGISFFTFQKMSYVLDVYKSGQPLKKITDFALYILLFPQLIAGPIVRYNQISKQLTNRKSNINIDNKIKGVQRFVIGLSKKMLIANPLGLEVDLVFNGSIADLNGPAAWIIIMAYAMQIYFDFSGYSDMAIGIGRILGFKIPENFRYPYAAKNMRDFWKRWHISLTNWFRDYLFLPLAFRYSRKLPNQKYLNLKTDYVVYIIVVLITFLLTGLWHGAAWTFVIWGVYHGVLLAIDRLFLFTAMKKLPKLISIPITFVLVLIGWVIFRADSIQLAFDYYQRMFAFSNLEVDFSKHFWVVFVFGLIISFIASFKKVEQSILSIYDFQQYKFKNLVFSVLCVLLLVLCMGEVVSTGFNPFIYFRF